MTTEPTILLFCLFAFSAPKGKKAKKQRHIDHEAREYAILLICFLGSHGPREAKYQILLFWGYQKRNLGDTNLASGNML